MKLAPALVAVAVGLVAQIVLARYAVGGRWTFDLVLVATVYAAMYWGPSAAMLAGAAGGLVQDALSGGIIGIGGLSKTIVGFAAGVVGGQFIVSRPLPRMAMVAAGTIVCRLLVAGLYSVIDQRWSTVAWGAMLEETAVNALSGWLAFQLTEGLPGMMARGRQGRRTGFRRREW